MRSTTMYHLQLQKNRVGKIIDIFKNNISLDIYCNIFDKYDIFECIPFLKQFKSKTEVVWCFTSCMRTVTNFQDQKHIPWLNSLLCYPHKIFQTSA